MKSYDCDFFAFTLLLSIVFRLPSSSSWFALWSSLSKTDITSMFVVMMPFLENEMRAYMKVIGTRSTGTSDPWSHWVTEWFGRQSHPNRYPKTELEDWVWHSSWRGGRQTGGHQLEYGLNRPIKCSALGNWKWQSRSCAWSLMDWTLETCCWLPESHGRPEQRGDHVIQNLSLFPTFKSSWNQMPFSKWNLAPILASSSTQVSRTGMDVSKRLLHFLGVSHPNMVPIWLIGAFHFRSFVVRSSSFIYLFSCASSVE